MLPSDNPHTCRLVCPYDELLNCWGNLELPWFQRLYVQLAKIYQSVKVSTSQINKNFIGLECENVFTWQKYSYLNASIILSWTYFAPIPSCVHVIQCTAWMCSNTLVAYQARFQSSFPCLWLLSYNSNSIDIFILNMNLYYNHFKSYYNFRLFPVLPLIRIINNGREK